MQTTILAKVRTLGGIAVCGALLAAATAQVADAAWCGVTVTADGATINLTANETCSGNGLTIAADSVTVNGNDHTITGSGNSNGVVIKNCKGAKLHQVTIKNFKKAVRFEGVAGDLAESNLVEYVTLENNVNYGVEFAAGSKSNVVRNSIVRNNGDEGVHFGTGSNSNVLASSSIYDNMREQVYVQTNVGGCTNVNNQHFIQFNCIRGGELTLKVDRSQGNYIRGNVFRDAPVWFTAGAKDNNFGQDGGTPCSTDAQCGTNNGDPVCSTLGKCVRGTCWGNLIDAAHLEFRHLPADGGDGTILPANTNTVRHLQITGQPADGDCVIFSGNLGGPLPHSNVVRDSTLACGTNAFQLDRVASDTQSASNAVCASTCNGATCTEGGGNPNGGSQSGDDTTPQSIAISASCP